MALQRFPNSLSSVKLMKEGFKFEVGSSRVEASFEGGRTYSKKSFRKIPDRFTGRLRLTSAELRILLNFFKFDLHEGVESFIWNHPITNQQISCQFVGGLSYNSDEGDYWFIDLAVEIIDLL